MDSFEDTPNIGPIFNAQFAGVCADCGLKIHLGNRVRYEEDELVHVACPQHRPVCTKCWLVHGVAQEECE